MIGARRVAARPALPRRRAARWAVVAAVLLLAVAAGLGVGLGVQRLGSSPIAPPPAPVIPQPELQPVSAVPAPIPEPAAVAALLDPFVTKGGLGTLSGRVVDAATGKVLWSVNPRQALVPGSTVKLLTAAAALLALDHQARLTTTVVAGRQPGTVILVGGGDPTLTALPPGRESVYPYAARLGALAAQVRAAVTRPVERVLVDIGRYTGPKLAPGWLPADVPAGYIAPIVPVMLDGGRADPTEAVSPRSRTPALDAAAELARRLGADPAATEIASAPPGARVLGAVRSAPIEDLVATLLRTSDNVLAEALARQVAIATGFEPSFAGAAAAVLHVLTTAGFDVSAAILVDGSGLSTRDRVPAALLSRVLAAAASPDSETARTRALRPILTGLPVAGGTGTLSSRYQGPAAIGGAGWVRAKTGTLTGVNSLAGIVLDADGRLLVFAFVSNGSLPSVARPRLDRMAAALRSCGCR